MAAPARLRVDDSVTFGIMYEPLLAMAEKYIGDNYPELKTVNYFTFVENVSLQDVTFVVEYTLQNVDYQINFTLRLTDNRII